MNSFFFRIDAKPDDCFTLKDYDLRKRQRNLSTLKCKKKVRYNKVSMSRSDAAEETKARDYHKDNMNVGQEGEEDKKKMAEGDTNLFSDANESTKLYKNSSMLQDRKVSVEGFSVHPEILV